MSGEENGLLGWGGGERVESRGRRPNYLSTWYIKTCLCALFFFFFGVMLAAILCVESAQMLASATNLFVLATR
jgi:hypothetical protein